MAKKLRKIPKGWQPLLWSVDTRQLDLEQDKEYIIHQILAYGSLTDIRILFSLYPRKVIRDVFTRYPQNIYTGPGFRFVKEFLLNFGQRHLTQKKYVQALF